MERQPRSALLVVVLGLVTLLGACGDEATRPAGPAAERPLEVRTTCFPVDWLVGRIAGDRVRRSNILPAGEDPPHWQPSADLVAGLNQADLIVANGAGYERWMTTAMLPRTKRVDTSSGLELIRIEAPTHSHGAEGRHSHTGTDPHTWADPRTYLAQAHAVHAALVEADPDNRDRYGENLQALRRDLEALDEEYAAALRGAGEWVLAAGHPSYNYLARRYGLNIRSFNFDPGVAPTEQQRSDFTEWAAGVERPVLLWESEPSPQVVSAFPERVRHVRIDPLEQPGEAGTYDYLSQARANVSRFEALIAR